MKPFRVSLIGGQRLFSGALQWLNCNAPCPIDPQLRQACLRTRHLSKRLWQTSVAIYMVGGWFAFVQPWLAV